LVGKCWSYDFVVRLGHDELPKAFAGTGASLVTLDVALRLAENVVVLVNHTASKHLTPQDLAG